MQTHNETDISIDGTSLMGYIDTTYKDLTENFGKPLSGDGYKTNAEWHLSFDDGSVGTIYDYGGKGGPVKTLELWHIGGHSQEVISKIHNEFSGGSVMGIHEKWLGGIKYPLIIRPNWEKWLE